jgi:hypothetical protein
VAQVLAPTILLWLAVLLRDFHLARSPLSIFHFPPSTAAQPATPASLSHSTPLHLHSTEPRRYSSAHHSSLHARSSTSFVVVVTVSSSRNLPLRSPLYSSVVSLSPSQATSAVRLVARRLQVSFILPHPSGTATHDSCWRPRRSFHNLAESTRALPLACFQDQLSSSP